MAKVEKGKSYTPEEQGFLNELETALATVNQSVKRFDAPSVTLRKTDLAEYGAWVDGLDNSNESLNKAVNVVRCLDPIAVALYKIAEDKHVSERVAQKFKEAADHFTSLENILIKALKGRWGIDVQHPGS